MKKSISIALAGLAVIGGAVVYALYPSPTDEKLTSNAELEQNPYMVFLDEDQKEDVRKRYAEAREDASAAVDNQLPQAEFAATEDVPKMSPELKSYIANAQPEKIMEFFAQARKERAEKIQAIMDDEGEDQEWKEEMLQYFTLSETLVPQMKGITLLNADCRESICALQVDYGQYIKNYKEIEPYMSNIGNLIGLDAWVHHDAMPHGGVIYFAKENTALPELQKI
ncbi:MAG: hypothetical protein CMK89_07500 [Pseudomonadales bacterium]|nr:hypothetical protein [Pseudomonadales bacterium]